MGTIERHENVLSISLLSEIHDYISQNSFDYIWRENTMWNKELTEGSAAITMASLEQFEENLREEVSLFVPEVKEMDLCIPFPMFYSMPIHSQIGWHEDYSPINVSIYLNESWDKNWGGLFIYMEDKNLKGYVPEFNTAVVAKGQIPHHVSMITSAAPVKRCSLQLFFADRETAYQHQRMKGNHVL
jgi:hypothetical protein